MNRDTKIELETRYSNAPLVDHPEANVPNGEYLAGLLLREIEASLDDQRLRPRLVAITFLSATQFSSPLHIAVNLRGGGKTAACRGGDLRSCRRGPNLSAALDAFRAYSRRLFGSRPSP
jgi:hypothetical protein